MRFIFGLKIRGLRLDRNLSLKELSKKTGLSPSYINEIEKGKKYPKSEKIQLLAGALGESYEDLISFKLKKELALVNHLLEKNVLHGLPLDIFGIPASTIFELLAERPKKMSALVGTLIEIARVYNISIDDFFFATLRSYLDMHQNYFPGIEEKVDTFVRDFEFVRSENIFATHDSLSRILSNDFGIDVRESDFSTLASELHNLHFFTKRNSKGQWILYVNARLSAREKNLVLARELGYQYLRMKKRPMSSVVENLEQFEELFNYHSATYFAEALLIPRAVLLSQLTDFFAKSTFDEKALVAIASGFSIPAETVLHRITQLLPRYFGLENLFFLRIDFTPPIRNFTLLRELHLSALHAPHAVGGDEHYCRRWVTTRLAKDLADSRNSLTAGTQRSRFVRSDTEYLNLAIAFREDLDQKRVGCVTVGILINQKTRELIKFLDADNVPRRDVGESCERCEIQNCQERMAEPRADLDPRRFERLRAAIDEVPVSFS